MCLVDQSLWLREVRPFFREMNPKRRDRCALAKKKKMYNTTFDID